MERKPKLLTRFDVRVNDASKSQSLDAKQLAQLKKLVGNDGAAAVAAAIADYRLDSAVIMLLRSDVSFTLRKIREAFDTAVNLLGDSHPAVRRQIYWKVGGAVDESVVMTMTIDGHEVKVKRMRLGVDDPGDFWVPLIKPLYCAIADAADDAKVRAKPGGRTPYVHEHRLSGLLRGIVRDSSVVAPENVFEEVLEIALRAGGAPKGITAKKLIATEEKGAKKRTNVAKK